jgi:prepilin-type N-terminal cleavage/methylation domain-containing protein
MSRSMRAAPRGFTLVELLVVMAIIATLVGLGMTVLPSMMQRAKRSAVENYLALLSANLETYKSSGQGAYPPTTLADFPGVGSLSNFQNCGIESLVLCLTSRNYGNPLDLENLKELRIENYDGDQTQAQLAQGGSRELFEIVDPWGTPLAYFHCADYGRYATVGLIAADKEDLKVKPWMNERLKKYYQSDKFQLISAGPDGVFNTEDDITNFDRR